MKHSCLFVAGPCDGLVQDMDIERDRMWRAVDYSNPHLMGAEAMTYYQTRMRDYLNGRMIYLPTGYQLQRVVGAAIVPIEPRQRYLIPEQFIGESAKQTSHAMVMAWRKLAQYELHPILGHQIDTEIDDVNQHVTIKITMLGYQSELGRSPK